MFNYFPRKTLNLLPDNLRTFFFLQIHEVKQIVELEITGNRSFISLFASLGAMHEDP